MSPAQTRPFEVPEALYPFADQWFERDGTAMHYVDHGAGQPVVMLHGNPTWSFLYRDIIAHLGDGVRSLAPDYPGFGFSEHPPDYGYTPQEHAEWIDAWIQHVDPEPFVLVMQDWGGPIGMHIATRHPERIAGLVILNTWAWPITWEMRLFSWVVGGPLGPYLHLQRNFFADKIVKGGMYYARQKPPEIFKAYTDPFPTPQKRMGTYVFPRAIRQCQDWLTETEVGLSSLADKPKELVWAMKDVAFGREAYIQRWLGYFPDAPVTRLEKASHYLQEDQPEAIADAIKRVVRQVSL